MVGSTDYQIGRSHLQEISEFIGELDTIASTGQLVLEPAEKKQELLGFVATTDTTTAAGQ